MLLAAALALVLAGCTKLAPGHRAPGERHPWTHPNLLRIATNADPKSLDPVLAVGQPVLELSPFLFSYTVLYDDRAHPVPDALREIPTVENGDVAPDGLTLRYKLRPNLTWHDGAPVTCRDLRFTWRVVMNPHNNVVTTDGYRDIRDIDCRDPFVAVVHMKRLYAPFLQQLWSVNGNAPILPEHLLARYNDDRGSFNSAPYQSAPIGSGPYRFVAWVRGDSVRLRAYAGYFRGKPKIDEVIYKIMPDANTLVTQLQTHELDLVFHGPPTLWRRLTSISGVRAIAPPIYTYDHIDFNLRRPVFADRRVRIALEYALDRRAMLERIQNGLGELAEADQSPSLSPAYDPSVRRRPYDPARARALLDAAGWRVGHDGIRARSGARLAFTLATQTESTTGRRIEEQVQSYWHDVGAEVTVKNAPTDVFFDNTANGILQGGRYDAAIFAWSGAADPDDSEIYSAHNLPPHGQNSLFWINARATAAMDDALATVDMKRRVRDYHVVQHELAADAPTIVLWFRHEPEAYDDDLRNFSATPVITTPFWNVWSYAL